MTHQKLNALIERAANYYATGNGRSSFPYSYEEKAFKAGANLLLPMLLKVIEALEKYAKEVEFVDDRPGRFLANHTLNSINERIKK
jgi:hypothetical protein